MRKIVTTGSGLLSLIGGLLVNLPDQWHSLRAVQIGLNELSWLPGIIGLVALLGGLRGKKRAWLAILSGGVGAALAAKPFLEYSAAAEDMANSMRAGFGRDYEAKIPAAMRARVAESTWSLENSLGKRERKAQGRLWRDIPFAERNGQRLHLDVYQPMVEPSVGELYPAIIVIHGGGWRHSDKGEWYFAAQNRYYASQGYVVFDIQYRLSDDAIWPAQLEDVQAAISWVKGHASDYKVDARRIALLGRSSGAHLALMAGYCPEDERGVQAIVSLYAPTELRLPDLAPDSGIVELMGGFPNDKPAEYDSATPIDFVGDGLPPTLMIEGGMDTIVPHFHGDKLANALSMTDTPFALLRAPWSRHGFDAIFSGLGGQLVQYHIDRFLAWSLYREGE
jgi:acetyl esterase/lipase